MYNLNTGWEEAVNFERLRKQRLARFREQMKKHDLGALVCFKGFNIRYMTDTGVPGMRDEMSRYSVLARDGEPVLFELGGFHTERVAPWMSGRIRPAIPIGEAKIRPRKEIELWVRSLKDVLKEAGVADEKIGIDEISFTTHNALKEEKINVVDGNPAICDAIIIKTQDELALLRQAAIMADAAFDTLSRSIKPGAKVRELKGLVYSTLYSMGSEYVVSIRLVAGEETISEGDLVFCDISHTFMGYHTCVTRTFVCGDKATEEQKATYRHCYDTLYGAINSIKPGATTLDVAKKLREEGYEGYTLSIGHGLGLDLHEPPVIQILHSKEKPWILKPNMYLAIENYSDTPASKQGVDLEEMIAVTETGYETYSNYPFEEKLLK